MTPLLAVLVVSMYRPVLDGDEADEHTVLEARPGILVPIGVLAVAVVVLGVFSLVLVDEILLPVADRLVG